MVIQLSEVQFGPSESYCVGLKFLDQNYMHDKNFKCFYITSIL